MVLVEVEQVQ